MARQYVAHQIMLEIQAQRGGYRPLIKTSAVMLDCAKYIFEKRQWLDRKIDCVASKQGVECENVQEEVQHIGAGQL